MQLIPLHTPDGQTVHAQVSDQDYPLLSRSRWSVLTGTSGRRYARGWIKLPGHDRATRQLMHRVIMGTAGLKDGSHTDHIDGNGLNNQRENLRTTTPAGNLGNRRLLSGSSPESNYRGVSRLGDHWYGGVTIDGKVVRLGPYGTEIEAAKNIALYRTRHSLEPNPEDDAFVAGWVETPPLQLERPPFVGIRKRADLHYPYGPEPLGRYATREDAEEALASRTNLYEERRKIWKEAEQEVRKRWPRQRGSKTPEQVERHREYNRARHARQVERREAERALHPSPIEGVRWIDSRWFATGIGYFDTQEEAVAAKLNAGERQREARRETARIAREARQQEIEAARVRSAERKAQREQARAAEMAKRVAREAHLHALRTARTKECRRCRKEKPRTELYFYPRPDAVDGFRAQCRDCYQEVQGGK